MSERTPLPTYYLSLVVVRNSEGKFLAVEETKGRGWFLPAGRVEHGETFAAAALRETMEEAGINVDLKGVLRLEHLPTPQYAVMRVVFYAEPIDDTPPKSIPDKESESARWVSVNELKELAKGKPGLRGRDLLQWSTYLEAGGIIHPLSILGSVCG